MLSQDFAQPRIRHITSFQIRNFTPFPLRDSVARAITKPLQRSSFPHGQHLDDLDLTISKKRARKMSLNSASTRQSIKSDGSDQNGVLPIFGSIAGARGRKTSVPKSEFVEGPSVRHYSTSPSNLRQARSRTASMSITELHSGNVSAIMFPDSSQEALENIFKARLVESRLVVTVFRSQHGRNVLQQERVPAQSAALVRKGKEQSNSPKSVARRSLQLSAPEKVSRRETTRVSSVKSNGTTKVFTHVKSISSSSTRRNAPSAVGSSSLPSPSKISVAEAYASYISPIHRPSTNPTFPFDMNVLNDDPSYFVGHTLKLEMWGRLSSDNNAFNAHRKGKEKQRDVEEQQTEWNIIDSWHVDLEKLLPLPDDACLPPNTPLITLLPLGQTYYFPSQQDIHTRSQSPDPGYSSEPESEAHTRKLGDAEAHSKRIYSGRKEHRRDSFNTTDFQAAATTTATWQDLSQIASLHSQVESAVSSLLSTQSEFENGLRADVLFSVGRQEQERNLTLLDLRDDCSTATRMATDLKERIRQHSKDIEERRCMLTRAQKQYRESGIQQANRDIELLKEQTRLEDLRGRITPTRTALLSTIATIFPIELYSLPDLLYTILDVPLPIPMSPNEPAPPLCMPTQKNVTEETVATALGYVAQVIQLMAAYLGKGLVYPVVCIGSRSLIRDNISAMVGPRLFPLFSKGVDTYRFEYGVFLLNKNIDILMMDRDLLAPDMRHTLPNLKNLTLTLTHGEAAQLPTRRSTDSTSFSLNDLDSSSSGGAESTTPKGENPQLISDGGTPPASGATTPTVSSAITDTAKSGRPLLGLSSLTDFIRLRYPSSHRSRSAGSDVMEGTNNTNTKGAQDGGDAGDDGMTIRHQAQQCDAGECEIMEDKVPLSLPSAMVLVPSVQTD